MATRFAEEEFTEDQLTDYTRCIMIFLFIHKELSTSEILVKGAVKQNMREEGLACLIPLKLI